MYSIDEAKLHSPRANSITYGVPTDATREFGRDAIIAGLEEQLAKARAEQQQAFWQMLSDLWARIWRVGGSHVNQSDIQQAP